ncbi:hypothetical protein ACFPOE_03305 [Caenimonas terrae]|uniref:Uncharacterized protein n=1 Tax=Caenimonas terrae TaxID=696074 RepID=A0ABW0N9G7_9BURK
MKQHFDPSQISRIIDQSLTYQCACPAQVGRAIFELRELHRYQMECLNDTDNDVLVHRAIAQATERSHALMEECLLRVLQVEGWDLQTLAMPPQLKARQLKSL